MYKNINEQRLDKEYFIYNKLHYKKEYQRFIIFEKKKKNLIILKYLGPTLEQLFNFVRKI